MRFRQKKGSETEVSKRDISTKERERERERVNSVTICTSLASSAMFVEGYMSFYSIKLTFFSLSWFSGRVLSCCSFPSPTNSIDLGQGWIVQLTLLSGLGLQDFLVLTLIFKIKEIIFYENISCLILNRFKQYYESKKRWIYTIY